MRPPRLLQFVPLALLAMPLPAGAHQNVYDPIVNGGFELYAETTGGGGYTDGALYWSHGSGSNARFLDADGDGDREAVVEADAAASAHNFWQATLPPLQVISANFTAFEFTLEEGTLPDAANVQIGFALSPAYDPHPFVGVFWEGALLFDAADLSSGGGGRVHVEPVAHASILCPDWEPCLRFRDDYNAAGTIVEKTQLLGKARVVQVSFWGLNQAEAGRVVVDDVSIVGAQTFPEEMLPCTTHVHVEPGHIHAEQACKVQA